MDLTALLISQLSDPFRIGLLVALVATMLRTRAATGTLAPLALGTFFVAAIIPLTQTTAVPVWQSVAVGLMANVILLAVVMAAWTLFQRLRG